MHIWEYRLVLLVKLEACQQKWSKEISISVSFAYQINAWSNTMCSLTWSVKVLVNSNEASRNEKVDSYPCQTKRNKHMIILGAFPWKNTWVSCRIGSKIDTQRHKRGGLKRQQHVVPHTVRFSSWPAIRQECQKQLIRNLSDKPQRFTPGITREKYWL